MEYKRTYIDAYKVQRKISRFERMLKSHSDAARRGFVEFVRKRSSSLGMVFIVFDGHGDAVGGGKRISVVYSLTRTADSWIRSTLERDPYPRMTLVISSDNEVRAHAASCGASLLSSQEFISQRREEREDTGEMEMKTRELSDYEVRRWLDEFGE